MAFILRTDTLGDGSPHRRMDFDDGDEAKMAFAFAVANPRCFFAKLTAEFPYPLLIAVYRVHGFHESDLEEFGEMIHKRPTKKRGKPATSQPSL